MLKRFIPLLALAAFMLSSCGKSQPAFMVYIPKNTGNPYFDPMVDGFKQAATEANVAFEQVAPATADATSQLPLIKAQIQLGAKVIAISPNSPEALKDPKYKEMSLVEVVYGDDQPEKSTTEAQALLTKYPDLRGIISPTTVGVAACAQVVESAGKASQVAVTGLGTPNQMRRFVQNGTVKAFQLWSPKDEGYVAGQLGIAVATGKVKPEAGAKFQAGEKGGRGV